MCLIEGNSLDRTRTAASGVFNIPCYLLLACRPRSQAMPVHFKNFMDQMITYAQSYSSNILLPRQARRMLYFSFGLLNNSL
jgi:hypothetical protein